MTWPEVADLTAAEHYALACEFLRLAREQLRWGTHAGRYLALGSLVDAMEARAKARLARALEVKP